MRDCRLHEVYTNENVIFIKKFTRRSHNRSLIKMNFDELLYVSRSWKILITQKLCRYSTHSFDELIADYRIDSFVYKMTLHEGR